MRLAPFWSMEIAGERPSIWSTSGFLQHAEELARVGRERLHVAALPFGKDRIEGQARLAGARETGNDHQLLARNVEVDVLEVVFARAADADELFSHGVWGVPLPLLVVACSYSEI